MNFHFSTDDLISTKKFIALLESHDPTEKAGILCSGLRKYLVLKNTNGNHLEYYLYDPSSIVYKKVLMTEDNLLTFITTYIRKSKDGISEMKEKQIKKIFGKIYENVNSNSSVKTYLPQIKTYLCRDIDFNSNQINEIHFRNGYYSFRSGKFKQRNPEKHFISKYIDRDYEEPSQKAIDRVMSDIKKVYPEEEDRNYILSNFGVAVSGNSAKNQTILLLIGKGSAGKSTIIDFAKLSLTKVYVHSLPQETLSQSSQNTNKIMNTFLENQCLRIINLDEPEDSKFNSSLFKQVGNGKIQTTSLYKDGTNDVSFIAQLYIPSNIMPNIKIDTGIIRRFLSLEHRSKFITKQMIKEGSDVIDESQHKYEANNNLLTEYENNNELLNAYFYIVSTYGFNQLSGKKEYPIPKNVIETKSTIIDSNDIIQDFIDSRLILTPNEDDRIGKGIIYNMFKAFNPKSLITEQQLINSLKDKNMKYSHDKRVNSIKGCFTHVRIKQEHEADFVNNHDDEMISKKEYDRVVEENKRLLKIIEELQNKNKKEYDGSFDENGLDFGIDPPITLTINSDDDFSDDDSRYDDIIIPDKFKTNYNIKFIDDDESELSLKTEDIKNITESDDEIETIIKSEEEPFVIDEDINLFSKL